MTTQTTVHVPTKELFDHILNGELYRSGWNVFELLELAVNYLLYNTKYNVYDMVNYLEPYIEAWRPEDPPFNREELFSNVSSLYQKEIHFLRPQKQLPQRPSLIDNIHQQVKDMKAKGYTPEQIINRIKKRRWRWDET